MIEKPENSSKKFPVIPHDRADDLHHLEILNQADLVLFMAGNQFMVTEELVEAFRMENPEVKNIYYETLPPGMELKQILAGGALFRNRLIDVIPDIYTSVNKSAMEKLVHAGLVGEGDYRLYLHNRLSLMVRKENPSGIKDVTDLAGHNIRISQPDPENEDIAFHIMDMYREAGGRKLLKRIMEEKRAEGTTIFTLVHHRETPLRIQQGNADVGPVWATEILHAKSLGLAIDGVEPGEELDQRNRINYYVSILKNAPNIENARKFFSFITSRKAAGIYEKYGFIAATKS